MEQSNSEWRMKTKDKANKLPKLYSLTGKAIDLVPIVIEIINWNTVYDKHTAAPKQFVERIKNDNNRLIGEIVANLKQT